MHRPIPLPAQSCLSPRPARGGRRRQRPKRQEAKNFPGLLSLYYTYINTYIYIYENAYIYIYIYIYIQLLLVVLLVLLPGPSGGQTGVPPAAPQTADNRAVIVIPMPPAPNKSTHFLLCPFVTQRCSTNCLGHGHRYECHSPDMYIVHVMRRSRRQRRARAS